MARKPYATPLRLEVRASPVMQRLCLLFALFAATALLCSPLPLASRLLLLAVLLAGSWRGWQHCPTLSGRKLGLVWQADRRCLVTDSDAEAAIYRLAGARLLPWLVVLHLAPLQRRWPGRWSLLIPYDAVEVDVLRRLRVRLRLEFSSRTGRGDWSKRG